MNTPLHTLPLLVATLLLSWNCSGQEFYHAFLKLAADPNAQTSIPERAPQLIDANNTAYRLTNTVLTLRSALRNGEIVGIRLGMSMEDVVAAWGKPLFIYGFCLTGPRFSYKDVEVFFEARSNAVERLSFRIRHLPKLQFDDGLSVESSRADWLRVFGPQVRGKKGFPPDLMSPSALIQFDLRDDQTGVIRFKRPPKPETEVK
jgi:hypothetical protein